MRKRIFACLTGFVLTLCCFAGCHTKSGTMPKNDTLHIVTTNFPAYDWVTRLLGDNPTGAEVTLLAGNGVDLHSYQATPADILTLSTCDLFIYVGGESDQWINNALRQANNPQMVVVDMMKALGGAVKAEEQIEGMQEEDEEKTEYDEHVWLSLRNASFLCGAVAEALCTLDSTHADLYKANLADYQKQLNELDADYQTVVAESPVHTLVFGDRFPFRYLADDYDLAYYAAFPGCSAETEAGFETIVFLAGKIDELSLHCVMTIDGSNGKIARTIAANTAAKNQSVLTLSSMQSAGNAELQNGVTYLSVMRENLAVLKQALQ